MTQFVLASASPRRALLLSSAGYRFIVDPPEVDESTLSGEHPIAMVERLAMLKARAGARRHPTMVVVGADTTVILDDTALGKPRDLEHARAMLTSLMGRSHIVATAVAFVSPDTESVLVDQSTVHMGVLNDNDLDVYLALGESLDKAGAYALQGEGGTFIDNIEGLKSTVIGLPIPRVVEALEVLGIRRSR